MVWVLKICKEGLKLHADCERPGIFLLILVLLLQEQISKYWYWHCYWKVSYLDTNIDTGGIAFSNALNLNGAFWTSNIDSYIRHYL